MKLTEVRELYANGALKKADYIHATYETHGALYEYARLIGRTDLSSIVIKEGEVSFTFRDTGIEMSCLEADERTPPLEALNFNAYEGDESELILKLVRDEDNILDIGANYGYYSLLFHQAVPNAQVYAFEPMPGTYAALHRNITRNQADRVRVYNFGLSDELGVKTFYYSEDLLAGASLSNVSQRSDSRKVHCFVKTLDAFSLENDLRVDFIKCDVEGAELLVFKGGKTTIERDRPVVFTEMLRKWASSFGYHPNDIIQFFGELGYECFTAFEGQLKRFGKVTEETVETNYFFLHPERHSPRLKGLVI